MRSWKKIPGPRVACSLQRILALAVACTILHCPAGAVPRQDPPERPNILLIVSEDNGPELGCYGDATARTPNLDALAASGTLFNHAQTTYSLCSPSRGSLYSGLYPHQNGQVGLATHKYSMYPGIRAMPAYLKEAGYRTGVLGKIHVNPETAIPFDLVAIHSDNFGRKNMNDYAQRAGDFIDAGDKPFLLVVNLPDAHFPLVRQAAGMPVSPRTGKDIAGSLPFVGVSSERLREFTADYYNCLERMDMICGQILERLRRNGKDENTVVIYLGDHGAQFSRGKQSNYEAGLRIPLIIRDPRMGSKKRISNSLVSIIDILPTMMDVAGISKPARLPGHSLLPAMRGEGPAQERRYNFSACDGGTSIFFHPTRGVRNKRYKLIRNLQPGTENPDFTLYASHFNDHFAGGTELAEIETASEPVRKAYQLWHYPPEYELYDLKKDPLEWRNLAGDRKMKKIMKELRSALDEWQAETRDPLAEPSILDAYIQEMRRVREKYPDHGYNKDPSFRWKFIETFRRHVQGGD